MSENKDAGTEMVPVTGRVVTTQQIEDAGLMMPVADPATIRAAFAERQRVLTSILDPDRDFVYSIRYFDREGKQKQWTCNTLAEAKAKVAFLGPESGASWSAHPKKSGVLKLAHALSIESRRVEVTGLPKDPRATFSSCTYIAVHKRTGRQEEGQGYCDKSERNQANHAIISMADTRAYCHAVLRCAGYDSVGADSMDLDDSSVTVTIQNNLPVERERDRPALVEQTMPRSMTDVLASAPPAAVSTPVAAPAAAPAAPAPAAAAPAPSEAAPPPEPAPPPEGPGKGDLITNAMAAELSQLLMAKLGSKAKAQAWLKENAGVERSIHVREDQIAIITRALEALKEP